MNNFLWSLKETCKSLSTSSFTGAYSEPCQTSTMEHFVEIINGFRLLTIFAKRLCLCYVNKFPLH